MDLRLYITIEYLIDILNTNTIYFKLFFHAPTDVPIHEQNYIKLPLDNDFRISVQPQMTTTAKSLTDYSPNA